MRGIRSNIICSLILGLLIAAAAWPVYVAVNIALGLLMGEGSVIDLWNLEPKRNLVADFINGYKLSAPIAILLGVVAVIDFQLLTRFKITGYFAGISVMLCCVAVAFVFYKDPKHVLTSFVATGLILWLVYKIVDIGCRLRRVG